MIIHIHVYVNIYKRLLTYMWIYMNDYSLTFSILHNIIMFNAKHKFRLINVSEGTINNVCYFKTLHSPTNIINRKNIFISHISIILEKTSPFCRHIFMSIWKKHYIIKSIIPHILYIPFLQILTIFAL